MPEASTVRRATPTRLAVVVLALFAGCKTIEKSVAPSNDRNWQPNQAVLPHADINGDYLTVHNIRNTTYFSADDYIVRHYDKTFDLNKVRSVDFFVVPFPEIPTLAHTMLSFGFADEEYLGVSVEVRREVDEQYGPLRGGLRQYELMYVAADERDMIQMRTHHYHNDVYLYRANASPQQVRDVLVDVMHRMNELRDQPEFYDTLTNNCTTNIVRHVNKLSPNRVPLSVGVVLPGHSDRLAYDLGLLDTRLPFEETKRLAKINDLALKYEDNPEFSTKIRQRLALMTTSPTRGLY